jgi:hypothetical protein
MTDRLTALEADGFKFCMKGAMLAVNAPKELLNPQAVDRLRSWRDDLITELVLRNFCIVVQQFSFCKHGTHIKEQVIKTELDDIDRTCLRDTTPAERSVWAEILAYRLCKELLGEEPPDISSLTIDNTQEV